MLLRKFIHSVLISFILFLCMPHYLFGETGKKKPGKIFEAIEDVFKESLGLDDNSSKSDNRSNKVRVQPVLSEPTTPIPPMEQKKGFSLTDISNGVYNIVAALFVAIAAPIIISIYKKYSDKKPIKAQAKAQLKVHAKAQALEKARLKAQLKAQIESGTINELETPVKKKLKPKVKPKVQAKPKTKLKAQAKTKPKVKVKPKVQVKTKPKPKIKPKGPAKAKLKTQTKTRKS
ncbi:MAG: hypothetical protein ABUK01_05190 [Leptospirales bacterium]